MTDPDYVLAALNLHIIRTFRYRELISMTVSGN